MPYEIRGNAIYHLKNGKWSKKQQCTSKANAEAALRLLNAKEHNPDFKERG